MVWYPATYIILCKASKLYLYIINNRKSYREKYCQSESEDIGFREVRIILPKNIIKKETVNFGKAQFKPVEDFTLEWFLPTLFFVALENLILKP